MRRTDVDAARRFPPRSRADPAARCVSPAFGRWVPCAMAPPPARCCHGVTDLLPMAGLGLVVLWHADSAFNHRQVGDHTVGAVARLPADTVAHAARGDAARRP